MYEETSERDRLGPDNGKRVGGLAVVRSDTAALGGGGGRGKGKGCAAGKGRGWAAGKGKASARSRRSGGFGAPSSTLGAWYTKGRGGKGAHGMGGYGKGYGAQYGAQGCHGTGDGYDAEAAACFAAQGDSARMAVHADVRLPGDAWVGAKRRRAGAEAGAMRTAPRALGDHHARQALQGQGRGRRWAAGAPPDPG
eukprot:gene54763-31851_t